MYFPPTNYTEQLNLGQQNCGPNIFWLQQNVCFNKIVGQTLSKIVG